MNEALKQILLELTDRLAMTTAALDALVAALTCNHTEQNGAFQSHFPTHQATVDSLLAPLRLSIHCLPE
jgi:hypothetical protein